MSSFISMTNLIYPVGSYYMSNSSTSPAPLFGGSWTQVTSRFLYGSTSVTTGGSSTHTHYYGMAIDENTSAVASGGYDVGLFYLYNYSTSGTYATVTSSDGGATTGTRYVNSFGARQTVSSYVRQSATAAASYSSTMPLYRTCYMWYRTS